MAAFRIGAMLRVFALQLSLLSISGAVLAQTEKPQYGGTLEIGTVYVTISALSWDLADWSWKQNHDAGQVYEQIFAGNLAKAKRNGGKYAFIADGWLPSDAVRGELAESWQWKDKLRLEIKLRQGVMFPEKRGVMPSRELTAADVVYSYTRFDKSPKKIATWFDHVEKVEAIDKYTVVFIFKEFNAEWDYRFGWGTYSGIMPKEVVDAGAGNWKNVNGTADLEAEAKRARTTVTGEVPSALNPPAGCRFHTRCPMAMAICKTLDPVLTDVGAGRAVSCHLHVRAAEAQV